ncbi:MAG TPA: DNA-3-methyladenine glycosylase [Dongiaceae bacterium]|nr:DNA-3-methyladenine glycosylase [Dongiaceae bacterium]
MEWRNKLLAGVSHLSTHDPVLAAIIASAPAPTFQPHTQYYQELVESIISQQLSVKAAATILDRFKALFTSDFPSPEEILEKDIDEFRAVGLSRQKASYIRDLAEKVLDGTVHFDHLDSLPNEEVIAELIQIKGVGVWTVHMFLLFCMGRFDVLPVGDLGIRNGIQKLYQLATRPGDVEIEAIAKKNNWHPYESIASWYIWHSLDNKPAIN